MRDSIHPTYGLLVAKCNCGNVIETRSTLVGELSIDVCSRCHPFYTGQQKLVDTAGRVEKFMSKYKTTASSNRSSGQPS